jgi:hypothetical protein
VQREFHWIVRVTQSPFRRRYQRGPDGIATVKYQARRNIDLVIASKEIGVV